MGRAKTTGFTLIELMVVVAIVAIVTVAVMPSFTLTLQRNRQREAAQLIVGAVFAARSRAARTGRCHRVTVFPDGVPGVLDGTGGQVIVDISNQSQCSRADGAAGTWTRLSTKGVSDWDGGTGVIGDDIAISWVMFREGGVTPGLNQMLFEPTGGLWANNNQERFFEILAFRGDGSAPQGVPLSVRVSQSGSVRVTLAADWQK